MPGPDLERTSRRERLVARLVAAGVALAVTWPGLAPLVGAGSSDGFPLSTYPMFSRDRGRIVEVPTAVVLDHRGDATRLSPTVIAGTDQVLVAAAAVRDAIAAGPAASEALCADVADRAGQRGPRVAVVVERHDAIGWSAGEREPLERRTIAECPVPEHR